MKNADNDFQRKILLRRLGLCSSEQQRKIRDIRNQPGIRASMYTDHIISEAEHAGWLSKMASDPRQIIFVVLDEMNAPIGVVSLNAIDWLHRKSDWAFYLDENERGGLGAALEYTLVEYAFMNLNLAKLNCEVIETNEAVVRMHKKFLFEEEGFRRSNIEKDGRRIGVFFLGLTCEDWLSNRDAIASKYRSILSKFEITIEGG